MTKNRDKIENRDISKTNRDIFPISPTPICYHKIAMRDTWAVGTCLFYNNFCVKSFLNQSKAENNKRSLMPEVWKYDFFGGLICA